MQILPFMNFRPTRFDWYRLAISIPIIAMSAYCGLQVLIAGIVYGDIKDLPGRLTQAADVQGRGHRYRWAGMLLQGLATLILAPVTKRILSENGSTSLPRYALAFIISLVGTGLALLILVAFLRTLRVV